MTIKDLSARTGYSVGTISRVLNNQPNVSEKAKKTILAAAEECGFQLNLNAKQLKQQHSNSILVVVKGTANLLFAQLVEAMQARMHHVPHPLIVDYIDEDSNEVLRAIQLCREKKPLGVLFLGGNRQHFEDDFDKIGVPCVVVTNNTSSINFQNLSSVSSDDVQAAKAAMEALLLLGHRQIAIIGGDRAVSDTARLRFQGCAEAIRSSNIPFDEELDYETVRFSYADGYRAAENLMKRNRPFTAIFAMSDVMAIGAIRALQDHGRRVPEDVAVIGFDGLIIGEYTCPRLATVRQDIAALADHSIRMLLGQITASEPARHETLPVSLALRESVGEITR